MYPQSEPAELRLSFRGAPLREFRTFLAKSYGTLMYWKASVNGLTMKESSYVKGPLTRSKRMLPVLTITIRAMVDREALMTVAPRAVETRLKMFPEDSNG